MIDDVVSEAEFRVEGDDGDYVNVGFTDLVVSIVNKHDDCIAFGLAQAKKIHELMDIWISEREAEEKEGENGGS